MRPYLLLSLASLSLLSLAGCPDDGGGETAKGGAAPVACTSDPDCGSDSDCTKYLCNAGQCQQSDAAAGSACGERVDGKCDGSGTCVAASCLDGELNAAETGVDCGGIDCAPCDDGAGCNVAGDCKSLVCNDNVCAPCALNAECPADHHCDAGACVPQVALGGSCASPSACLSGFCVDDVCCDTACDAACDECASAAGTCTVAGQGASGEPSCAPHLCDGTGVDCPASCSGDGDCVAAGYCDSVGDCIANTKPNGVACAAGNECQSGSCVDAVCCGAADCPGECLACNVAGSEGSCAFEIGGTVCRASIGGCDPQELCSGASPSCPANQIHGAGTVCRASTGGCDPQEVCNGVVGTCPADALAPVGAVCRPSAGGCDPQEVCTGVAACPADVIHPAAFVCQPSAGGCDPQEVCNGVSATCPSNMLLPLGTVCNPSQGVCDPEETCDGATPSCPANVLAPNTTMCRPATGECDLAETCTGMTASCPADAMKVMGAACGSGVAQPVCNPDSCDGFGACVDAPPASNGLVCSDDALFCSGVESCQGGVCQSPGDPCGALSCDETSDMCVDVWINEIHYDNVGVDVDEGIELAGSAGTALSGWSLALYNGATSTLYATMMLSGTIPNEQNGFGTLNFAQAGIQNGPDGIALVNPAGVVVQFLSYEGAFSATDGPAATLTSTNIGVAEDSSPLGTSLQLTGSGQSYAAFSWTGPIGHTRGAINSGQSF